MHTEWSAFYFEVAAVIVALVLLGEWLELAARGRTSAAIRQLLELSPKTARRIAGSSRPPTTRARCWGSSTWHSVGCQVRRNGRTASQQLSRKTGRLGPWTGSPHGRSSPPAVASAQRRSGGSRASLA